MTEKQCIDALGELLAPHAARVERDMGAWLVEPGTADALAEAMRYCALGPGKRLRPALVYLAAGAVGNRDGGLSTRRAAVAVELIHTYSLVHDDLPALDDDALRRGRPTAHVLFGEAMAILVGDALLTRGMGVLAESDSPLAAKLLGELTRAAGPAGMIGGQVADMGLCDVPDGLDGLKQIHMGKTAALIAAAGAMGALSAGADQTELQAIADCSKAVGLGFQVVDDVLDVTGTAEQIGKTPGKDAAGDKRTYVALLGLDRATQLGRELTDRAVAALAPLGDRGSDLVRLVRLLGARMR